eukprot:7237207-Prorocentrum_lima.AAC.1
MAGWNARMESCGCTGCRTLLRLDFPIHSVGFQLRLNRWCISFMGLAHLATVNKHGQHAI